MAAAVLHSKAQQRGADVVVSSAGTASYHVGEGPNPMSHAVWSAAGYSYQHVARQFTAAMFDHSDLVLVMDAANHAAVMRVARTVEDASKVHYLRSFDPELAHVDPSGLDCYLLEVPDPWEQPRQAFERVLEMVERSVEGLLDSRG